MKNSLSILVEVTKDDTLYFIPVLKATFMGYSTSVLIFPQCVGKRNYAPSKKVQIRPILV